MNRFASVLIGLLTAAFSAPAQEKPPAQFETWGVCPFECCTYREWEATQALPIHAGRSDKSPVLFRLRKGERVDALTGVVVTARPAAIVIDKPVQDGFLKGGNEAQLSLKPGDTIYFLAPLGEGAYVFWYQGKTYQSGLALQAMPIADNSDPGMVWWKQIKNKAGKTGWTRSVQFSNADACG